MSEPFVDSENPLFDPEDMLSSILIGWKEQPSAICAVIDQQQESEAIRYFTDRLVKQGYAVFGVDLSDVMNLKPDESDVFLHFFQGEALARGKLEKEKRAYIFTGADKLDDPNIRRLKYACDRFPRDESTVVRLMQEYGYYPIVLESIEAYRRVKAAPGGIGLRPMDSYVFAQI